MLGWLLSCDPGLFAAVREATFLTCIHLSVLTASIFAYRLFWHPLQSFPGPRLARLSKLLAVPITFSGDMPLHLQRLHQQYGDFVRTGASFLFDLTRPIDPRTEGPNELSIVDAEAVVPIYGSNGWEKDGVYTIVRHLKRGEPALQDTIPQ